MEEWRNEQEYKRQPLTGWDKFWLAVLGLITCLWISLLGKLGGWVVWWIKGVFG